MKKMLALTGVGSAAVALTPSAHAVTYEGTVTQLAVDPTVIYTAVQTPFTAALTFTIGAIAVLAIIRWIRRGMSK